jgi:ABC-type transporter Mla maintaining outer membrane lipid asymmetry ATPase subunit MlaF
MPVRATALHCLIHNINTSVNVYSSFITHNLQVNNQQNTAEITK